MLCTKASAMYLSVSFSLPSVASGEMLCVCTKANALYMYHSFYQMSHQGKCFAFVRWPVLCIYTETIKLYCIVSVCIIPFTKCRIREMLCVCSKASALYLSVSFLLPKRRRIRLKCFVRRPVLFIYPYFSSVCIMVSCSKVIA